MEWPVVLRVPLAQKVRTLENGHKVTRCRVFPKKQRLPHSNLSNLPKQRLPPHLGPNVAQWRTLSGVEPEEGCRGVEEDEGPLYP